ncbi:type VII secretion-associated serine protease mycosin [Streptomyces sp. NPDC001500]
MHTSTRHRGCRAAASAVLGLLLVTAAGTLAHAESTREEQWFLDAMKADQMWQTSTGEGVTVAVIDTGVDPDNPDLKGRVLPGKDLAPDQSGDEHTDYEGHGTGMGGLIAGTGAYGGGNGAFGLAPGAKILPIRLPNADTAANLAEAEERFNKAVAPAIRFAADKGVKVINISQAATEGSPQLTAAVKYALGKGSLIFAGVGNNGGGANEVMYPAATPGVVGVAAVGKDLRRTAESEHGPQVDMAAPGEDMVHACDSETGLCRGHGTSDASALASASAALIWAEHPAWTNNQILRVMLNTIGVPTDGAKRNDSIGYGIVRPRIALQSPGDPGPADAYPLPDLAAAASKSPSPQTSETAGADAPAKDDDSIATASASSHGSAPWVALGTGAVVLLGAALAVSAVVRRRRAPAAALPTPASAAGQFPHVTTGFTPTLSTPPGASDSVTPSDRGPGPA